MKLLEQHIVLSPLKFGNAKMNGIKISEIRICTQTTYLNTTNSFLIDFSF